MLCWQRSVWSKLSEKAMTTRSSDLAWRIPGTGEPGDLPSVGLHRAGHDWRDLAAAAAVVKAVVFPVVMDGCERWTIRKEVKPVKPRGNQPWISLERLMLKLKLQCFGHLMQGTDSLQKTLMLGKTEDKRRKGWLRMRWLDGITDSVDMNLSKL